MFLGVKGVWYKVSDIKKARDWYVKIFNVKPVFDTSLAVRFSIGDSVFSISQGANAGNAPDDGKIAYWEVDDIETEYKRMLEHGASVHTEINIALNRKMAAVIDPFGNIIGLRTIITDNKKLSVEQAPSQTAMAVTISRAMAAVDEREEIRGRDHLAQIFLPEDWKLALKEPSKARQFSHERMPGMYEYMNARTAFFDNIVRQALREDFSQIIFLGAGYDTRPYRFKDLIKNTRIFEVDAPATQRHKIKVLRQNNISIPGQLSFVPVNFNTETLEEALSKAGYIKNQKNLFIWEGVTYYLSPKPVDDIFAFIKSGSSTGSIVCFDYGARWPGSENAYGFKEAAEVMRNEYSGEPAGLFIVEKGKIESFLADRGFKLIRHLTAEEMERKYLTLRDGSLAGKVAGVFCLAQAAVSD